MSISVVIKISLVVNPLSNGKYRNWFHGKEFKDHRLSVMQRIQCQISDPESGGKKGQATERKAFGFVKSCNRSLEIDRDLLSNEKFDCGISDNPQGQNPQEPQPKQAATNEFFESRQNNLCEKLRFFFGEISFAYFTTGIYGSPERDPAGVETQRKIKETQRGRRQLLPAAEQFIHRAWKALCLHPWQPDCGY